MTSAAWRAPSAVGPVTATVRLPGSKSITNRALVLAALAAGTSRLLGALVSRDTDLMEVALGGLGVEVRRTGEVVEVCSNGPPFPGGDCSIDVGNAGTVARFVPPLATLAAGGPVYLHGDERIHDRPLAPLVSALHQLGGDVHAHHGGLPLRIRGTGRLRGGSVELDASASSQLISGLLLAAPAYDLGVEIRHRGPRLPSRPHLEMTVTMLRAAGAVVDQPDADCWAVHPGPLHAGEMTVEPDLSSAAPFLAAALVTAGTVTVAGWPAASAQPGARLPSLLERMGARCRLDDRGLSVTGGDRIHGLDDDLGDVGELVPVLTVLAALAQRPSRLRGIGHLRGQETDRLAALATEIDRLGGAVTETPDGLAVAPRPLSGGTFSTYDDHRLAMAAAVLGLAVPGVLVENVETTGKAFPGFVGCWTEMLR